jgi:hypothetical protein
MGTVCRYCGLSHSDWFGCDEAANLGFVEKPAQPKKLWLDEAPALMEVIQKRVQENEVLLQKPKFDRVAAMAHARQFRKKK